MNARNLLSATYKYRNQMNWMQNSIDRTNKRLSTGKQINSAADNPSVMLRMSRLEAQIRGSQTAQGNIQDGIAFLDKKDSALAHAQEVGNSLRDLAVKYQNDTMTENEKEGIVYEATELVKELDYVFKSTRFNKKNVFDTNEITIQTGPNSTDTYTIKQNPMTPLSVPTDSFLIGGEQNSIGIGDRINKSIDGTEFSNVTGSETNNEKADETFSQFSRSTLLGLDLGGGIVGLLDGLLGTNIGGSTDSQEPIGGSGQASENSEVGNSGNSIEETDVEHNPNHDSTIASILDTSFIDDYILDPIASQRTETGVARNVLEHRLNFQKKQNEIQVEQLSRIQDVDTAKELMEKAKNELLLETNVYLFQEATDQFRTRTLQLLYGG